MSLTAAANCNYNYETQKLKNLEQLKDLSFILVGCSLGFVAVDGGS